MPPKYMRKKFTVAIQGSSKRFRLQEQIYIPSGYIIVADTVTINWDYKNLPIASAYVLDTGSGNSVGGNMGPGYATFSDVANFFEGTNVKLTALPVIGKCKLRNENPGKLGISDGFPMILGFETVSFGGNTEHISENKVDFALGLKYVKIHCDIVDDTRCMEEYNGYTSRSKTIATIPLPTGPLSSVSQHVTDLGEGAPVEMGSVEDIELRITDQDNKEIDIGLVLISFTITRSCY